MSIHTCSKWGGGGERLGEVGGGGEKWGEVRRRNISVEKGGKPIGPRRGNGGKPLDREALQRWTYADLLVGALVDLC